MNDDPRAEAADQAAHEALVEASARRAFEVLGGGDYLVQEWEDLIPVVRSVITDTEPIIRADALSRFSITEFPNGKIQTLIADGTHWVTVSTANSMVDRARADEAERHHDGGDCECTSVYADGTWVHAQRLADLRARVKGLPFRTWVPPHAMDCPGRPGKRGICTCGDSLQASDWVLRSDVLGLFEEKP